ncbi:MAG: DUF2066 domain-containing protein [Pseudomonadales bacterium]|nr:DUF2066 domain-containing protein [Pseudomonadales bacterium]
MVSGSLDSWLERLVFIILIWVMVPNIGHADINGGWLYRVAVPVEDQSTGERHRAGSQALDIVLKRVTGLAEIERTPAIEAALGNPQRYYHQYAYSNTRIDEQEGFYLNVRFDNPAIARLVRDSSLPVWSANRPNIIAWIVVERSALLPSGRRRVSREILGADQSDPLLKSLKANASNRGLPLIFPTMDLKDQQEVTPGVVWGQLSSVLFDASRRYNVDAMLLGRIVETPLGYRSEWHFARTNSAHYHAEEQSDYEALAPGSVDFVARILVQKYAVASGESGLLRFVVRGVAEFSAYSGVLKYLEALEFVDSVQIEEVQRDELLVSIQTNSSWQQFIDLLALDDSLQPLQRGRPNANYGASVQNNVLLWQKDQH